MDSLNPPSNPLKPDPSTPSKKPFKVYRKANKEVWNNRGLQILIKKHRKDFHNLECHQFLIDPDGWQDPFPIDRRELRSLTKIMRTSKSPAVLKFHFKHLKLFTSSQTQSQLFINFSTQFYPLRLHDS